MKASDFKTDTELISKRLQYELAVFFKNCPPRDFNIHIRNLLLDYLTSNNNPDRYDFKQAIECIWKLMKLIDIAQEEVVPRTFDEIFTIAKEGGYAEPLDE